MSQPSSAAGYPIYRGRGAATAWESVPGFVRLAAWIAAVLTVLSAAAMVVTAGFVVVALAGGVALMGGAS